MESQTPALTGCPLFARTAESETHPNLNALHTPKNVHRRIANLPVRLYANPHLARVSPRDSVAQIPSTLHRISNVSNHLAFDAKRRLLPNPKHRSRDEGTNYTWYNWLGDQVANEASQGIDVGDGTLEKTYIGRLAEFDGSNLFTGDPAYYMMDHLGSVRSTYDANDALIGATEFTPFGSVLNHNNDFGVNPRFTAHHLDPSIGMYFAPFRYMTPEAGRWLKNDPSGSSTAQTCMLMSAIIR